MVYSNILNKKIHVGGTFCDLAKAFNCVNHEMLLAKLYFYCIQRVTADWFRSYLTNIIQQVETKSPNSTQNFFSECGTLKRWSRPRVHPRALIVHNLHERPSTETKFLIITNIIC